jgi:hypothetical protein
VMLPIRCTGRENGASLSNERCVLRSLSSRYQHSADAVLLKAADAVADETARLMGEASPQGAVVPLRL